MSAKLIAVVGAHGFVGSAVVDVLLRAGHHLRLLIRRPGHVPPGVETVASKAGLHDRHALGRLLSGAEAVIHAASYTGSNEKLQQSTNADGTQSLAQMAHQLGVGRLIYVSTAGVYGTAFHSGLSEETAPQPRSRLSASRLAAERSTLDVGGVVIRPNFVLGEGDRWVLAPYLKLIMRAGGTLSEPRPVASVINRTGLAQIISAMIEEPTLRTHLYHVAEPNPVSLSELADDILSASLRRPAKRVSRETMKLTGAHMGFPPHKLELVLTDSWLNTRKLWTEFDHHSLSHPILTKSDIAWYSHHIVSA
ncbi:MAG: NAD-dependent epimerase/dehydratase family protein [Micropruina sp.]|uniref:NAD-dependent epimerase/dehydratase family protein n=1 Tax=Micropruina sp. TaxID=2737536 RepID=UPI0039E61451